MAKSLSKICNNKESTDGRDLLDLMFCEMYPNSNIITISAPKRCTDPNSNTSDKILSDIISQKIETKTLPLTLRKRLLYEQALAP